jgi:hypothetical protein
METSILGNTNPVIEKGLMTPSSTSNKHKHSSQLQNTQENSIPETYETKLSQIVSVVVLGMPHLVSRN